MIRHITIFTIAEDAKPEGIARMQAALDKAAASFEGVRESQSGTMLPPLPGAPEHEGPGPVWGDVVQILTFETREDAEAYPASEAHAQLGAETEGLVAGATAIDFEF